MNSLITSSSISFAKIPSIPRSVFILKETSNSLGKYVTAGSPSSRLFCMLSIICLGTIAVTSKFLLMSSMLMLYFCNSSPSTTHPSITGFLIIFLSKTSPAGSSPLSIPEKSNEIIVLDFPSESDKKFVPKKDATSASIIITVINTFPLSIVSINSLKEISSSIKHLLIYTVKDTIK